VTRRTGEITPRQVDRDYPHQVEIAIPEGGLGTRLSAMDEFCRGLSNMRYRRETAKDRPGWRAVLLQDAGYGRSVQTRFGGDLSTRGGYEREQ